MLRVTLAQPVAQQVGNQVVVAIPATLAVERHKEQVRPLKPFQGGVTREASRHRCLYMLTVHRPPSTVQYRVTQRPAYALEDGRGEQKLLDRRRLLGQHLVGEVVEHKAMRAAERGADAPQAAQRPGASAPQAGVRLPSPQYAHRAAQPEQP